MMPRNNFCAGCAVPRLVEGYFILLLDLETRMRQALRQVAVVRENEQPFALRVEPPDIEEPWEMRGQQIENGIARVRIFSGRNESGRLVQHEVEPLLRSHHFAADLDVIGLVRLRAEIGHDATVDGHATGRDQFIAMPPRTDAGRREIAIEAQAALGVGLGFGKAHDFAAFLPLPAFLEQLDALETLQDIAFGRDGAGAFETAMLRHKNSVWESERAP